MVNGGKSPGQSSHRQLVVLALDRDGHALAHVRRLVEAQLLDAGLASLVDAAALAATELATNALIHTDSDVSVSVATQPELLRVAVQDRSPIPPVPGALDETSMCGRGLLLVTRVASRWGFESAASGGKSVWFEMQPGANEPAHDLDAWQLLDMWAESEPAVHGVSSPAPEAAADMRSVRLPRVRADLLHGAKSHLDDLVRECLLVAEGMASSEAVRDELGDLARRLTHLSIRLVSFRNQVRRQALAAGSSSDVFITLELELPASLHPVLAEYRGVLDEVERLSGRGVLLTGTEPREHLEFDVGSSTGSWSNFGDRGCLGAHIDVRATQRQTWSIKFRLFRGRWARQSRVRLPARPLRSVCCTLHRVVVPVASPERPLALQDGPRGRRRAPGMVVGLIRVATVVALAVVALAVYRQQRRGEGIGTWSVFLAFALLAAASAALALLPNETNVGFVQFARQITLALLPLFPYFLFRFSAELSPPPRWFTWIASGLTAAVIGSSLLIAGVRLTGASRPGWYVGALLAQWTLLSVVTAVKLWRLGRGEPTIARRRMRTLSVATMGLTITLLLAGALEGGALGLVVRIVPLASALLFLVALAPPAAVRAVWRRPEEERLRPAIADLMSATSAAEVTGVLLPHVANVLGGRGVALIAADGTTVAEHGARAAIDDSEHRCVELVELSVGRLVVFTSPYTPLFGRDELELVRGLAGLAELALTRGQEHRIAETLQRSLLPHELPALEGLRLEARYLPGGAGAVGGDWYDVIPLRNGCVGLVIGDVMGHGIGAAALMGQLRSALRAYAIDGDPPGVVLSRLDALMQHFDVTDLATVLYLVLDTRTSTVRFASAGHLPPMLHRRGERATSLEGGLGPPLGIWAEAPDEGTATLPPGATLLLFTDGLVERRGESITVGISRVARALEQTPEARSLSDHLIERLLDESPREDDVAILLISLEGSSTIPPSRSRVQSTPSESPGTFAAG